MYDDCKSWQREPVYVFSNADESDLLVTEEVFDKYGSVNSDDILLEILNCNDID